MLQCNYIYVCNVCESESFTLYSSVAMQLVIFSRGECAIEVIFMFHYTLPLWQESHQSFVIVWQKDEMMDKKNEAWVTVRESRDDWKVRESRSIRLCSKKTLPIWDWSIALVVQCTVYWRVMPSWMLPCWQIPSIASKYEGWNVRVGDGHQRSGWLIRSSMGEHLLSRNVTADYLT